MHYCKAKVEFKYAASITVMRSDITARIAHVSYIYYWPDTVLSIDTLGDSPGFELGTSRTLTSCQPGRVMCQYGCLPDYESNFVHVLASAHIVFV